MSCPDCFSGFVHEGNPRGSITTVHGLATYVTEPADGRPIRGVIVIIPDAFGWDFVNNRLLADHYADKGDYRVLLPDFMHGYSAPVWMIESLQILTNPGSIFIKVYHGFWTAYGFLPWLATQHPSRSYPTVVKFVKQLREGPEACRGAPIFAAGFCWGGKHAVLLAGSKENMGRPLIDAGFTGHPSWLNIPEDLKAMTAPVSFALGDKDYVVPPSQVDEIEAVVRAKQPEASRGEVVRYNGVGHGFCVRADNTLDDVSRQAAEAEDQAIAWFNARL